MRNDVTGIILAGGKSARMGKNKALLEIKGEKLVERTHNLLRTIFPRVIIITNTPEEYTFLKIPVFRDFFEYRGPLAGIHSGLIHSETELNFVISVDMPLITESIINYIADFPTEKPITVCKADGYFQQLAGKYSKSLIPLAEKLLTSSNEENSSQKYNVSSLLEISGAEIIEAESLDFYRKGMFYNMNRPEDYKFMLSYLEKS